MNIKTIILDSLVICLVACGSNSKETKNEVSIPVETEVVSDGKIPYNYSYVGEAEAGTTTTISFVGSGMVKQMLVEEGQTVKKGQLLAVMDEEQCRNGVMAAQAVMTQAQDAYNRMEILHSRKALSDMDWMEMQSKLTQAKSSLQIAQKILVDCNLEAPCSGVIGKKMAEAGQVVLPSQPIYTILDINNVKVSVSVPEKEIGSIKNNMVTSIKVNSIGKEYQGGTIEKGVEADAVSRTYVVKVNVLNTGRHLLPGMVCDVTFVDVNEQGTGLIAVPISAIGRSTSGAMYVWKVVGGVAVQKEISVGQTYGNRIEVEQGLKAGDEIIVKGFQKVSGGQKVTTSSKR